MTQADQRPGRADTKQVLLTCMDPRLEVGELIRLLADRATAGWEWEAEPALTFVLRNAGATVTEDTVRSLLIVKWLAASPDVSRLRIAVVGHEATTGRPCAMTTIDDDAMRRLIATEGNLQAPAFALELVPEGAAFGVRRSVRQLEDSRLLWELPSQQVRGFVYNTDEHTLRSIETASAADRGPAQTGG